MSVDSKSSVCAAPYGYLPLEVIPLRGIPFACVRSLTPAAQAFLACGWAYGNVFIASRARLESVPADRVADAERALASAGRNGGVLGHYYERFFRSLLGCR